METIDVNDTELEFETTDTNYTSTANEISHYPRQQIIEQATLSKNDMYEISQCRRVRELPHA